MSAIDAYKLITGKLELWLQELIKILPNVALAAIVLVLGLFMVKMISRLLSKFVKKISRNTTLNNLLDSIIYVFLVGIVIFVALNILKLDKVVTTVLASAGIIGLALAFAFQDIAANFMSGIFISFRRPLHVNDIVRISDYMGRVEEINLRDTVIRTFQGQMVIIPNKDVFQNPIENFTLLGKRRVDLAVGVSYGDDLEKVRTITLAAVQQLEGMAEGMDVTMFYKEFGDSSINFEIRMWVNSTDQPAFLKLRSDAVMAIKKAYDENDIMIPFPIRTLDFGIKGGQTLSEMSVNLNKA